MLLPDPALDGWGTDDRETPNVESAGEELDPVAEPLDADPPTDEVDANPTLPTEGVDADCPERLDTELPELPAEAGVEWAEEGACEVTDPAFDAVLEATEALEPAFDDALEPAGALEPAREGVLETRFDAALETAFDGLLTAVVEAGAAPGPVLIGLPGDNVFDRLKV